MALTVGANGAGAANNAQTSADDKDVEISRGSGSPSRTATPPSDEPQSDEEAQLNRLAATVQDQDELEKTVGRQADQMLLEQADERDQKRLEKTELQKQRLDSQIHSLRRRLEQPQSTANASRIRAQIEGLQSQTDALNTDLEQINTRINERHQDAEDAKKNEDKGGNRRMPGETQREFLIRTGKITPFSRLGQSLQSTTANLSDVMLDAEENPEEDLREDEDGVDEETGQLRSHRNLLEPGFAEDDSSTVESVTDAFSLRPRKKRRLSPEGTPDTSRLPNSKSDAAFTLVSGDSEESSDTDTFGVVAEGQDGLPLKSQKKRRGVKREHESKEDFAGIDDGNESVYQARLKRWKAERSAARRRAQRKVEPAQDEPLPLDEDLAEESDTDEWIQPHPTRKDTAFDGGLALPGDVYPSLFDYQKTGVQWLWELYQQQVGGIVGDEMGLGKTIQIIAFLAGLHHSGKLNKPVVIVCPATVMKQWVNEFHRWWPPLRVSILHSSGSGGLDTKREGALEDELETRRYRDTHRIRAGPINRTAKRIVDRVVNEGHVLVTTYSGLQTYSNLLIPISWGYAVLDEGHKIRNPNAGITIYCKELRTPNRIILSGTPIQNNLTELWSLFDFVFPMRLGTLVDFHNKFEIPIKRGGYANASNLEVETANKCAETLKDSISPYLLQRYKVDVAQDLPQKKEQVLFCRITKPQREAYEKFLNSDELSSILNGKRHALFGIDILRKVCNHPDLVEHKTLSRKEGYAYGKPNKSGKMQVVKDLLELWKTNGHKTLLFTQQVIMLDILEKFIGSLGGFKYRRMDGSTAIKDRQALVDEFNQDPSINLFLLTTKVGGLGINLTGADRVIIYDPDWNPSTDIQARERAWRLGQKREVRIYRLMTVGTIEEKIYHRQIFKQFLTNKILRDPKQRQSFQLKDLHDLFTLGDTNPDSTETSTMFKDTEVQLLDDDDQGADAAHIDGMAGVSKREIFHEPEVSSSKPVSGTGTPTTDPVSDGVTTYDNQNKTSSNNNNDTRLLSSIFTPSATNQNIHSAHSHESIITNSSRKRKVAADPEVIGREAKKVAADAAKTLQKALEEAKNTPAGVPTWTGTFGVAGRPEDDDGNDNNDNAGSRYASPGSSVGTPSTFRGSISSRGNRQGPSSSSVLANLSSRSTPSTFNPSTAPSTAPSTISSSSNLDRTRHVENENTQTPQGTDFLTLIRDFLVRHGGFAYTQMLIDHFNRFCATAERTQTFKEMLREIAVLEKPGQAMGTLGGRSGGVRARQRIRGSGGAGGAGRGGEGRGKWVLKREFGGTA